MAAEDYNFNATRLDINPNQCTIDRELKLEIDFEVSKTVSAGQWSVKYIVDSSYKRHVIELGSRSPVAYGAGKHTFTFSVDKIDVAAVKRNLLLNVGLLSVSLKDGDHDVIEINMVTQVSKDASGNLVRTIFNPLE